ncbi:MAG: hypothetical protein A2252_04515 [Elusimicrobia bacterium RIFOXYA2_FULL_39_19]|nr:MAG: hypothetical protein A2252_04515 [Elusimicrobia bacterium RIFOXYA2_FULL_39_19]
MNIGIDIDDTITAMPEFFKVLTEAFARKGHQVHIVTSRTETEESRRITEAELSELGIKYNHLHFIPSQTVAERVCPHRELDWYNKYLWQKVAYCLQNDILVYFDDDPKVVTLFRKFASKIKVLHVINKQG